jgi:rubredoxin
MPKHKTKKPDQKDYGWYEHTCFDDDLPTGWVCPKCEAEYKKALAKWELENESRNI